MYVFHWVIVVYFYHHLFHTNNLLLKTALFPLYVLIVYIVAEISFRLFESKFLILKDKLSLKPKDKVPYEPPIQNSIPV